MNNFDDVVNRLGTYSTQWDYTFDRFGRSDVLPFSISDMDFKSPPEILKALSERINHGVFGYSRWNHSDYKSAITQWYTNRFNYKINDDWIMYIPSVIYGINKVFEVLGNKNDTVLFLSPAYDNFYKSLTANQQKFITSHLIVEDNQFVINWQDFEAKLQHSKYFLLCNPHNPTGRVWTEDELTKIVVLAKKYGVLIVSDDIHMDIVYKPHKFTPVLKVAEQLDYLDKVLVITSASKSFNTPSLGGAYALIRNAEIYKKLMAKIKEADALGSPMILGIIATMTAYEKSAYWLDNLVEYCYNNMIILQNFLKEHFPEVKMLPPEGTYLAWIDVSSMGKTSAEIQNLLINKGKLGIMSGDVYGEEKPFLRLNVGCPKSKLLLGLDKFKESFQ
ncbi:MAG: pyridoxal phosphate-dependent aminotransferase [Alphaproteobacteria bacterium]|jgi:cystathionine beta-lyase|nr:pyridoxal phosphate-dependent aminotransferase [Alphaproteobacteria bacterium]